MCWSRNNLCRGDLEIRFHFDKRIMRVTQKRLSSVNQVNVVILFSRARRESSITSEPIRRTITCTKRAGGWENLYNLASRYS